MMNTATYIYHKYLTVNKKGETLKKDFIYKILALILWCEYGERVKFNIFQW